MDLILRTFGILLYSLACYALGSAVWKLIAVRSRCAENASKPAACVMSFLLGQCILATAWLILAMNGWLNARSVVAVLVAGILLRFVVKSSVDFGFLRNLLRAVADLWSCGWVVRILFLASLLVLVQFTLQSIGPFLFYTGDSTAFYMVFPKIIANTGRLVSPSGYEVFLQMGIFGELHYAALMAVGSGSVAKLFTCIDFIALMVLMMTMAGGFFGVGRIGQLLILTMLLTSTTVSFYIYDGKVDLYAATLGMAAVYWVFQIKPGHSLWVYRLIGFFTGVAILAKLSLAVVLFPVVVLLVVWRYRQSKKETNIAGGIPSLFGMVVNLFFFMLIGYLPQLIKNAVLFGEPLSPFFYFGSHDSWLNQSWIPNDRIFRTVLLYPILLVFGRYPLQGGGLSPMVLAMLPLGFLFPWRVLREKRELLLVTLVGILGTVLWVIVRPAVLSPRYILPILLLFLFPAAYLGEAVLSSKKSGRILSWLLLILAVVLLGFEWMRCSPQETLKRFSDLRYEGDYPDVRMSVYINETVPSHTPILWLGYTRYYLNSDLILATEVSMSRDDCRNAEVARLYLKKKNIQYILYDSRTHMSEREIWGLSDTLPGQGISLVHEEGELKLYRVDFNDK